MHDWPLDSERQKLDLLSFKKEGKPLMLFIESWLSSLRYTLSTFRYKFINKHWYKLCVVNVQIILIKLLHFLLYIDVSIASPCDSLSQFTFHFRNHANIIKYFQQVWHEMKGIFCPFFLYVAPYLDSLSWVISLR